MNEFDCVDSPYYPSDETNRLFSDLVSDFLYLAHIQKDGNFILDWVSNSITTVTGYTPQDIINQSIDPFFFCYSDDIQILKEHFKHLLNNQPDTTVLRFITKKKEIRWVRMYTQPKLDVAKHRVTKIYSAVKDITDLKWSEISLKIIDDLNHISTDTLGSIDVLHKVIQILCEKLSLTDGSLWQLEPLSNDIYCIINWQRNSLGSYSSNLTYEDISYRHNDGLPGRVWATMELEWIPDLSNSNFSKDKELATLTDMHSALAFPVNVHGEKSILMFMTQQLFNPDPILTKLFHSISHQLGQNLEYKKSYEELHQIEQSFKTILNAIPDLIFLFSQNGAFLDYYSWHNNILFSKPEDVIGNNLSKIFPPEITQSLLAALKETIHTREMRVVEFQTTSADITYCFEARLIAIGTSDVLFIIRDISEQVRIIAMKNDFINRTSHELRTPLTTSILTADLLQEGGSPEEITEYWHILRSELERQRVLIEQILTFSKLENEKLNLNITPVNIITILKNAIATISPIAKMKRVDLLQEIPEELPVVMGDQIGLHQVIVNLLNNAIKFSNPENEVFIKADIQDEISNEQGRMETGVSIWIQDHGIGIPEEDIPKLFTKFYRAQNAINNDISGSGIGLYITKSIVDELKGKIKIESKINKGTTFEIWLPSINDARM